MASDELVSLCLQHGASKAFLLDVAQIPFDAGLHEYCKMNACGGYGKNYACPPAVGEPEALIREARGYSKALVYQTINEIEDSYDFEGMQEAAQVHEAVSNRILAEIAREYQEYLELRAGGCKVCPECAIVEDDPCRHPMKKRASLEAYCINVSSLAEKCEMQYINGANTVTYFGAFLID